ncbi:unnamed protein product [Heterosigma akashiwo]
MSSSLLERARMSHEWIEHYENAVIEQLEKKPKTNKEKVYQQHRIDNLLGSIAEQSEDLKKFYNDDEKVFKEELQEMRGRDFFASFYSKLRETREYHMKYPNIKLQHQASHSHIGETRASARHPILLYPSLFCCSSRLGAAVAFSGEELYGRYLDLHALHAACQNLPAQQRRAAQAPDDKLDYGQYLETFTDFASIPPNQKNKVYAKYISDLWSYITGFFKRTQPLVIFSRVFVSPDSHYDEAWRAGTEDATQAWENCGGPAAGAGLGPGGGGAGAPRQRVGGRGPLDLGRYHARAELAALAPDRLGGGAGALGMKCGGTAQQRASGSPSRAWARSPRSSSRGKVGEGRQTSIGRPPLPPPPPPLPSPPPPPPPRPHCCRRRRHQVGFLCEQMRDVVEASRRQVEKKQTRTVAEREAEVREEEEGVLPGMADDDEEGGGGGGGEEEDSDDEGPVYNPLNLPLGWDGKPIPYWLYKLHGLGVEFKCEVCGGASYMGRRAFDRHFQEWRHAHGMRCLGIPNTKHFHDITTIEDAKALYKAEAGLWGDAWGAVVEEEYEDSEGNVLNRRTYEDLARQGLL